MTLNRQQVEEVARRNIQESLDNFMPDNGHLYVNGSFSRDPYWHYERQGVKNEAYQNTVNELKGGGQ